MVLSCFNEDLIVLGYNAVPLGKWLLMFIGTQCLLNVRNHSPLDTASYPRIYELSVTVV